MQPSESPEVSNMHAESRTALGLDVRSVADRPRPQLKPRKSSVFIKVVTLHGKAQESHKEYFSDAE